MIEPSKDNLHSAFKARYSEAPTGGDDEHSNALLQSMASRGSCRAFSGKVVEDTTLNVLCAVALASATKSDLQQRDIILLKSASQRQKLSDLVSGQTWVAKAPMIAVFCGNNRRQRLLHDWQDVPFANDHLDAFFNAATDAAIALGAFVTAAEALGLGCCPISAVRNEAAAVSDLLGLPAHVFPLAGLAIGYPTTPPKIAKRLPLGVTCHVDRYNEEGLKAAIQAYDLDRAQTQPYSQQRFSDEFGVKEPYGWSDDKVRQYSRPERASFQAYIKGQGFRLDR